MEKEHQELLSNGWVDYVVIRTDKITPEQFEKEYTKYTKVKTVTQKYLFVKMYDYVLYKLK